jgi:hypothetical protein
VAIGSATPPNQPEPKGGQVVWAYVPHIDASYGVNPADGQPKKNLG